LPSCTITSPINGEKIQFGDTVTITVQADDPDGDIVNVQIYIDDMNVGFSSNSPYSYQWLTADEDTGIHIITAKAVDNSDSLTTDEISVKILPEDTVGTVTDFDGNVYKTIKIGEQWWMAENLKTTHYADGSALVDGTDSGDIFSDYDTKYYFWYNNDSLTYAETYGALYTWAAVMNKETSSNENPSGVQGICPVGWHVPSDEEWKELEMFLGMSREEADETGHRGTDEGAKMK